MIVLYSQSNDSNLIKIIVGSESKLSFYAGGPIELDLQTILKNFNNKNKRTLLQVSFCENEEELSEFIQRSRTENERKAAVASTVGDLLRRITGNADFGDFSEMPESNNLDEYESNSNPPKKSTYFGAKCPTCSGPGLIDANGNVHQCESCTKLDMYEKLMKNKEETSKPKSKKKKPTKKDNPKNGDENGTKEN